MSDPFETSLKKPKALLVGIEYPNNEPGEAQALLEELVELAENTSIHVVHTLLVKLKEPSARFLTGSGKAQEIIEKAKTLDCNLIVFDDELSPAQQRNWEKEANMPVIDRNEVILDIFAQRAQTREATLQVELARLEYMLPRLKRAWTHLSRQRGGGGVTQRGEGETQLEIDQRLVRQRISRLKNELEEVVQHREVQRKKRMKVPLPSGAIVGYTNAGKSSLINRLTGAHTLVENKLFATLDPTTRKLELPHGQTVLITDTVGFVRRLPHRLIEAFKATLEEAVVADFLIHLIDISSQDAEAYYNTTCKVLEELGLKDKPVIVVLNKVDLDIDPVVMKSLRLLCPEAIEISTKTSMGLQSLLERIESILETKIVLTSLWIPHTKYELVSLLYEVGAIKQKTIEDEGTLIVANVPERLKDVFQPFIVPT